MTSNTDKNRNRSNNHQNGKQKDLWNTQINVQRKCSRHSSARSQGKTDSVLSTDSDIQFTRRKLGDTQKCGCALIAGFLIFLLLACIAVYVAFTFFRSDTLPERIFRGKLRITEGDRWTPELADQSSLRFQHKAKYYQEGIDAIINRSDLRNGFQKCEILALDGDEERPDLSIHFNLHFDPYRSIVSSADLLSVFMEQIGLNSSRNFANLTLDAASLDINEVTGLIIEQPSTSSSPLGLDVDVEESLAVQKPPRRCEQLRLPYCQSIGYNITSYPNLLGHKSFDDMNADLIAFRELVDSECFRQAFDFVCRLLQPPCRYRDPFEPVVGTICRDYCIEFQKGCGSRIPERFKAFFDCERFPESTGAQSCHSKPNCVDDLQTKALSNRLCDGIPDCPDLSDETKCSYCPLNSLYCGRGRACIPWTSRCDGKLDCPDGSDERDCLSIAPLISELNDPHPVSPQQSRFYPEGFATFSEKGETGKLCTEGLDSIHNKNIQRSVAESLCKALGYEKLQFSEVRNDSEPNTRYVRVLDPTAPEISFIRTDCEKKEALYVACANLDCGVQSILTSNAIVSLPKMAASGDWPWHVSLHRDETHLCDGTLVSDSWVLTTESCFQGQSKATWIAVFGNIRLSSTTPWTQRRRIVGMVKSPVEGSTAALVRLETPVVFSDFIRPICLPDITQTTNKAPVESFFNDLSLESQTKSGDILSRSKKEEQREEVKENRDYFIGPDDFVIDTTEEENVRKRRAVFMEDTMRILPNETDTQQTQQSNFPASTESYSPPQTQWTTCNTLGWSRQREHLQRVQLKISHMASCENISIATVNSMCTEAMFHKQDCTEEEYAGSPVMCVLPDSNRWALVGVASWRIACAANGVERPRMYDKIAPNSAWIRHTINAT